MAYVLKKFRPLSLEQISSSGGTTGGQTPLAFPHAIYAAGRIWWRGTGVDPGGGADTSGGGTARFGYIHIGSAIWSAEGSTIKIYDDTTGTLLDTLTTAHSANFTALSTDGTFVYAIDGKYFVKFNDDGTVDSEIEIDASLDSTVVSDITYVTPNSMVLDGSTAWVLGRITTTPTIFKIATGTLAIDDSGTVGTAGQSVGSVFVLGSVLAAFIDTDVYSIDTTTLAYEKISESSATSTHEQKKKAPALDKPELLVAWNDGTTSGATTSSNKIYRLNNVTGKIQARKTLSVPPTAPDYPVAIAGADYVPGVTPGYATYKISVYDPLIVDVTDFTLCENVATSVELTASGGTGGTLVWNEEGTTALPPGITFDEGTATFSGTPSTVGSYHLDVTLDDGTFSHPFTITIEVQATPVITTTSPLPDGTISVPYSETLVATGPTVTWLLISGALPGGLSLNAGTGEISGTPSASGVFNFTVEAESTDTGACFDTQAFQLTIDPGVSPTVLPFTLPDVCLGTAYDETVFAVGGTPPYVFSVSSGALPTGLTLDPDTGEITGIPTVVGVFNFDITATDDVLATGTRSYTIEVFDGPVIVENSLPAGCRNNSYSTTLTSVTGTAPYTWAVTSGALPTGLTLDPDTGEISGISTVVGSFTFEITVNQTGGGCTNTKEFTLVMTGVDFTNTPPNVCLGRVYSFQLYASGTPPKTWVLLSGDLPIGLSVSSSGLITGTPTQLGTWSFILEATNGSGCVDEHEYTIAVNSTPEILTTDIPNPVRSVPYSTTLERAILGTEPYMWSLVGGTLPVGLTLNTTTGIISGTPVSLAGSFSITVRLTDANGCYDEKVYAFDVVLGGAIVLGAIPDMCSEVPVDYQIPVTGGVSPTITLIAGNLPAGVLLENGYLVGTPITVATYAFTLRGVDVNGQQTDQAYSVEVHQSPVITLSVLPVGFPQAPYAVTITVTAGGPYVLSIPEGELPPGLVLDNDLLRIYGIPTVPGQYTFTLRATDENGCYHEKVYVLYVKTPLQIDTLTLPKGCEQLEYSQYMLASGGNPPYFWSVTLGSLPPGLALNPGTGELYGIPNQMGVFSFTVQVIDSDYNSATKTYVVEIRDETCGGELRVRARLISLASEATIVIDSMHQDTLYGMLPSPLIDEDRTRDE